MLPSILDIAQTYHVEIDSRTYGKKETRAKCPFCKEDAHKRKKFYLSLNTHDQVYRCFFCGEKGGVLQFEAKLSDMSFTEVKEKYFGKNKTSLHPAYRLNPYQLSEIGWKKAKREDFKGFLKNRDQVEDDWKEYVFGELVKHYALFLCIEHLEDEKKVVSNDWFMTKCKELPIPKMYEHITKQYAKRNEKQEQWAVVGLQIARVAWKVSIQTADVHFDDIFVNVLLADYVYKKTHSNMQMECVSAKYFV